MNNSTDNDEEDTFIPIYWRIIFGIIIAILIFFGIIGNVLTILSYIRDKKLHSVYNTYLLNLSVTDLLLSLVSMPIYAVYTLQSYIWPFGYHFCKVFMVMDFTLCMESILMMMIISFDRLFLLRFGSHYTTKITMLKAFIQIFISYVIGFLLYGPAVIGWDIWTGENIVAKDDCDVQFAYDLTFTSTTAFIEFGVPFICISTVNIMIYYEIRKRNTVSNRRKTITVQNLTDKTYDRPKRDLKAAKFLAALVVVFLVTWAPYTISTIIIALCEECVNKDVYEFFNWLLYSKAAINPFLYAYNSSQFKKNFKGYFPCFKKLETNKETNSETV